MPRRSPVELRDWPEGRLASPAGPAFPQLRPRGNSSGATFSHTAPLCCRERTSLKEIGTSFMHVAEMHPGAAASHLVAL